LKQKLQLQNAKKLKQKQQLNQSNISFIRGDLAIVRYFMTMMLFCLLLSSCTQQHSSKHKNGTEKQPDHQHNSARLDTIIQQEAMLVDVPIPLYDQRILSPLYDETERDTLVFGYKSPLTHDQAVEFFIKQMERYGWRHLVSFDTFSESVLQFESPDRYCTVLIKNSENTSTGSSIFIYIKRASTEARS
jgi:hypothetical protein